MPRHQLTRKSTGNLYNPSGYYRQVIGLHKRALAIMEKSIGPDHPQVACLLRNLAEVYTSQGSHRQAEAEVLYKRALAILEKPLDNPLEKPVEFNLNYYYYPESLHDRNKAEAMIDLAMLYESQGQDRQAKIFYKRAIAIFTTPCSSDLPYAASLLSRLGEIYYRNKQYASAEPLYKRALAIRENIHEGEHLEMSGILNKMALLYEKTGRIEEAMALKNRSSKMG
jgi:tetratricopeptide (TPR) repeat protein